MIKLFLFLYSFFVLFSVPCSVHSSRYHPYQKSSKKNSRPLFTALHKNHTLETVQALVAKGADLAVGEPLHNDTILIKAADKGRHEIVDFLLDQQVHINACNNYGQNIAWAIAQSEKLSISVKSDLMKKIVAKGGNLKQLNQWGKTLLHVIDEKELLEYVIDRAPELINVQDQDGNTPLHDAQTFNNKRSIATLLGAGAKPFIQNKKGLTYYEQPVLFNKDH